MATPDNLEKLKYPVGKFVWPQQVHATVIEDWIGQIDVFPNQLKNLLKGLDKTQLEWAYRPGGWTIAQVVHHCADSHMNSFIRFKLALTEDLPTIKPYNETKWASLPDVLNISVVASQQILIGLHMRWVKLLESLSVEDLDRSIIHPEHGTEISLRRQIGLYAWHGKHHLAHIQQAIASKGKF